MRFEAADGRDVFALVALDALDEDFGGGFGFGGAGFEGEGPRGFLLGVFFGAFLGVEGEGGEGGGYCCCLMMLVFGGGLGIWGVLGDFWGGGARNLESMDGE